MAGPNGSLGVNRDLPALSSDPRVTPAVPPGPAEPAGAMPCSRPCPGARPARGRCFLRSGRNPAAGRLHHRGCHVAVAGRWRAARGGRPGPSHPPAAMTRTSVSRRRVQRGMLMRRRVQPPDPCRNRRGRVQWPDGCASGIRQPGHGARTPGDHRRLGARCRRLPCRLADGRSGPRPMAPASGKGSTCSGPAPAMPGPSRCSSMAATGRRWTAASSAIARAACWPAGWRWRSRPMTSARRCRWRGSSSRCGPRPLLLHRRSGRRLLATGHSAGGHLTGMLMATDWRALGLPAGLVPAGLPISACSSCCHCCRPPSPTALRLTRRTQRAVPCPAAAARRRSRCTPWWVAPKAASSSVRAATSPPPGAALGSAGGGEPLHRAGAVERSVQRIGGRAAAMAIAAADCSSLNYSDAGGAGHDGHWQAWRIGCGGGRPGNAGDPGRAPSRQG